MEDRSAFKDLHETTRGECFLMASLTFMNIVNYMDRLGIAAILVKIQREFTIGDDYGGLLQTILLVWYTITAPMFGYAGDRYNRKWLLVTCISFWGACTVLGAFSGKYWTLLLSRAFVGIGMAGFTTISPSIISDISVRAARSVFLACFYIGIPIGAGLGYVTVNFIAKITGAWKYGLCAGPTLCIIGVILLSFCTFPERGLKENNALSGGVGGVDNAGGVGQAVGGASLKDDLLYLVQVPSFLTLTAAFVNVAFLSGAISWWFPTCLYYGFQLIPVDHTLAILSLGLITIVTGFMAIITGLILSTWLRPRFPNSDPIICGTGQLIAFPMIVAALFSASSSEFLTFLFIFLSDLSFNVNWAIFTDMLLYVIIPIRRSTALGFNLFVGHSLGDCISPYIVGFLSEYFQDNYVFSNNSFIPVKSERPQTISTNQHFRSIQLSLMITAVMALFASSFCFLAVKFITDDKERVRNYILTENSRK